MMTAGIQRIFDEMNKQAGAKALFIFLFILVASPGIKAASFAPTTIIETLKTETLSHQPDQGPLSELEGTHFNLSITGNTLIEKTVVPFYLLPVSVFYGTCISLENFQIKRSSLLIKITSFTSTPLTISGSIHSFLFHSFSYMLQHIDHLFIYKK